MQLYFIKIKRWLHFVIQIQKQSKESLQLQQKLVNSVLQSQVKQPQQNIQQQRKRKLIQIDVYGDIITIDLDEFTHDTDLLTYVLQKLLCPVHYKDLCCILYYTNEYDAKILKSIVQVTILSDQQYKYKFQVLSFPQSDVKLNLLHSGFLRILCKQEMEYIINNKSLKPTYEQSLQVAAYCCQANFGPYKQKNQKHILQQLLCKYVPETFYNGKSKQSRNKNEICKKIIKLWEEYSNNQTHTTYLDLLLYLQRNISYSLYYIFDKFENYNIHISKSKMFILDKDFHPVLKDTTDNIILQYTDEFLIINYSLGQLYIKSNQQLTNYFFEVYKQIAEIDYPSFISQGRICDTTSEDGLEIPEDLINYSDTSLTTSHLRQCSQIQEEVENNL